jgi:cyclopropane-fatty-acyl-phospholipid synthase
MRVLDIGCGFGEALKQAASKYGVTAVGITISERQADYARRLCAGLPVEIKIQDYRKLEGEFDRVFSIGMFEHVGPKNYRTYMNVVRRLLAQDGLFLLHTIGSNDEGHNADPWMEKYIFPNSALPSPNDLCKAVQDLFLIEDWHNFGADYDPTLLAWRHNFQANWERIKAERDGVFYRMWNFYLSAMAAAFRARRTQLWQLVLSPHGVAGGYRRPAAV